MICGLDLNEIKANLFVDEKQDHNNKLNVSNMNKRVRIIVNTITHI